MAATNRQKKVIGAVSGEEFNKAIELFKQISQEAKNSVVPLPCKNEDGDSVINRDNNTMRTVSETLDYALSCISRFCN